jgi:hypothetical protein
LNSGIFYYLEEPEPKIAAAQEIPKVVNKTNATNDQFNELKATSSVIDTNPRTKDLTPSQNISEAAALRVPAVETRMKFMELAKSEKSPEGIHPSPEESSQQLPSRNNSSLISNETTAGRSLPSSPGTMLDYGLNSNHPDRDDDLVSLTNTTRLNPLASSDTFRIYYDFNFTGKIPSEALLMQNEPAVAKDGDKVFYVGTFYAANSSNGGRTWSYIDLFSQMPSTCCDSDLTYDDRNEVFLWSMMNLPYNSSSPELGEVNNITIGVSEDMSRWTFYDISPTTLNNSWTNNIFDYPQLFLTDKFLYISTNRLSEWFTPQQSGHREGPVMMRIERDLLSSGASNIPIEFMYSQPPNEIFTAVQGSDNILYWATHITNATNSTMRLYSWADGSSTIRWIDRTIANWTESNIFYCASPDNHNWCSNSDNRITGGWIIGDVIGFLWNVPSGGDFPYSHVDAASFNTTDMRYLGRPYLWSENHDWMFAYVSPDKDRLGIVAAFGGGNVSTTYPSAAVGIGIPDQNDGGVLWTMYPAVNGTSGPKDNVWGDYFRAAPTNRTDNEKQWIGTGFVNSSEFIQPHYFEFGLVN